MSKKGAMNRITHKYLYSLAYLTEGPTSAPISTVTRRNWKMDY